jgi:ribosomal protein S18 acetylase RimI-like enzyme
VLKGPVQVGIRRATAADARRLAVFAADAFRATYGPRADPACGGGSRAADVEAYVAAHFGPAHQAAELADPGLVTLLGLEAESRVAAYAQVACPAAPGGDAELARLYVAPPWHGRGVARALLAAAVRVARDDGAARLRLAVYQRNRRAVAFYRRQGFAATGTAEFQLGAERQADWIMVLPLC